MLYYQVIIKETGDSMETNYIGIGNMINFSLIREVIQNYQELIDDLSEKIGSVDYISNKTNLLALNATIEAIHASDLLASFEQIVGNNLLIQAKLLAKILEYDPDIIYTDGAKFAKEIGIEEFYVTDGNGNIEFTNHASKKGTRISTPALLRVVDSPDAEVVLPATASAVGDIQYKVAAASRIDKPGLIQFSSHFIKPSGQEAIDGFGVIAQETKRLADLSKDISEEVNLQTKGMIDKITELNTLSENFDETEDVKAQARKLREGLKELREYFKNLLSPLSDLVSIAKQTSLLGVSASIEAAHSTNEKQDFDNLLNTHMVIEAKLMSMVVERMPDKSFDQIVKLTEYTGVAEVWVTDSRGVVEHTNREWGQGFAFQNDGQTGAFMAILSNPNTIVTQPPAHRDIDGAVYKYVGVARRDKHGICQIGNPSRLYGDSTAKGFSEVSKQIKALGEQSKALTTEMEEMIREMDMRAKIAIDTLARA